MAGIVQSPASLTQRLVEELSRKQDELDSVARVLHESVGQLLTVAGLQLDVLRQEFSGQVPDLARRAGEIQQLLERAVEEVRRLSYRLNPDMVQRSGLRYAMDALVGKLRESSGATIRLLMDANVRVPSPVAVALHQISEQAIENAIRHSKATLIEVVLQRQANRTRLEVRDNGAGFDPALCFAQPKGLGLLWMKHLADRRGLDFSVESAPGAGSTLRVSYHEPEAAPREPEQRMGPSLSGKEN